VILERAEVVDGPGHIPSLTILRLHIAVYAKQFTKVRHACHHRNKQEFVQRFQQVAWPDMGTQCCGTAMKGEHNKGL